MNAMSRWRILGTLCVSIGLTSQAFAQTSMTMAIRYDFFTDDETPKSSGYEITVPLGIAYKHERFSLSLESAYSSANADWADGTEASLSSCTDTLISATYSHAFSGDPYVIMAGVDLNLPSGRATLDEIERRSEAGESNDLFEVDEFGNGLNIGPSIGMLREFDTINLAIHTAYIFNGEYDPTSDISDDTLDPGDQAFILGAIDWQTAPWLQFGSFISYSYFTPDKNNNKESFREGQRAVIGGHGQIIHAPLSLTLSLQYSLQDKNEVLIDDRVQQEPENSNGKNFFGLTAITYAFSQELSLRAQADVRYYGESQFKDELTGLPFSGKRVRYAFGPGFHYRLRKDLACHGLFKLFTMSQDANMFEEKDLNFWGTNLDLGLTYVF